MNPPESPSPDAFIKRALSTDLIGIRWLLDLELLPSADLSEDSLEHFLVCRDGIGVVGAVGLEVYGHMALLRSLVVTRAIQGCGLGKRLVSAAEDLAVGLSVRQIYLLTTNAAPFFESIGFRRIDREQAPAEIHRTSQFATLCPATAVLMVKP